MACRDYESDYDMWLQRSRDHFARIAGLVRQLADAGTRRGIAWPPEVANGLAAAVDPKATLSKEVFDATARTLCQACRAAEEQGVEMPPPVAAWWADHKARDEQPEDLTRGLDHDPGAASFWAMHADRQRIEDQMPGVARQDAIRALERAGFRVVSDGRATTMSDGVRRFLIPRGDPVNGYALANVLRLAGIEAEAFRKLLS